MGKRKRKTSEDRDSATDEIDYSDLLITSHELPYDPIDDVIRKKIKRHGFPHPLHLKYQHFGKKLVYHDSIAEHLPINSGRWTDIEKQILDRNVQVILNSQPVKYYWADEESQKHVIVAIFGYCRHSKYFDSPYKWEDIFTSSKLRLQFKMNLGRGLPDRLLHSCYDWCRRTYNPFKNYTENAYKKAIEECRALIKQENDRYNYVDVSAKNEVDIRTIQKIYQNTLTATGEDPYHGLYEPVEDWIIVENLLHQSGAQSYEQLIKMIKDQEFRPRWKTVSKALNFRSEQNAATRWKLLRDRIKCDADYELLKKYAKRYHKDLSRIIYCLYREKDQLESQVDWYAIGQPRLSFKYCVARFQHLKTWVPPEIMAKKSHRKTVKWLYKNILPNLTTLDEAKIAKLESYYRKRFYTNS